MNHTLIGPTLRQPRPVIKPRMAWRDSLGVERTGEVLDIRTDGAGLPQLLVRWDGVGCVQSIGMDARDLRPLKDTQEAAVVTVERVEAVEVGVGRGGQLGLGL